MNPRVSLPQLMKYNIICTQSYIQMTRSLVCLLCKFSGFFISNITAFHLPAPLPPPHPFWILPRCSYNMRLEIKTIRQVFCVSAGLTLRQSNTNRSKVFAFSPVNHDKIAAEITQRSRKFQSDELLAHIPFSSRITQTVNGQTRIAFRSTGNL